ncbi:MAG TPA: DUF1840 domain-containing protein [Bordetella sp.]|uniref:DUF1840 domain-containing protein n=1 Tax=Bordetella sp. TaxID=28081 RepID=UPI002ED06CFF
MFIKFHSKAAADVMMRVDDAAPLLRAAGKAIGGEFPTLGVLTHEQLPAAIAGLEAAVHASPTPMPDDDEIDHRLAKVTLRQRAFPLLEMMHASLDANTDILWERAQG